MARALEGATIGIDAFLIERYSDDDGAFDFANLPAGDYAFTITLTDYLDVVEEVTIEEGDDDIELEITLLQATFSPEIDERNHDIGKRMK